MIKKAALAILAAIGLAGCVMSSGTVYYVDDPFLFFGMSARGGFPVMVLGDPYPGRQREVEAGVIKALESNFRSFGPAFRVVPPAKTNEGRLVVLFGMTSPFAKGVCADPTGMSGISSGTGEKLLVSAVYCVEGPYSASSVSVPRPAGPDSPDFLAALDRLVYEAIPREMDPSRRNDSRSDSTPP